MRWKRTIQLLDVHAEGEIGRVAIGGVPKIPGDTIAAQLHWLNTDPKGDELRRFLCLEPRGALVARATATSRAARAAAATIHRPETAYSTSTPTGAPIASSAPHSRAIPRCARAHQRPAPARARPTRPSSRISQWLAPTATTAATAAATHTRANRARARGERTPRPDRSRSVSLAVRVAFNVDSAHR